MAADILQRVPVTELERQRQKECESKAVQIVERLLDNPIRPDWLLDAAKFINRSHYQDAVEERNLEGNCGYPLCTERLRDVPQQKYRICRKTNEVIDLTELKKYCSNKCYHASKYFEAQLLTAPLWLRSLTDIPRFKLIDDISESEKVDPDSSDSPPEVPKQAAPKPRFQWVQMKEPPSENYILQAERFMRQWFTPKTLRFLLSEKPPERYDLLCAKLEQLAIESTWDKSVVREEKANREKVGAFVGGQDQYAVLEPRDETQAVVLPPVDSHAQNALRRRIMLDRLERVMADFLQTIHLTSRDLGTDLRELVSTFHLTPQNIVLLPQQWALVGLAFTRILSLRNTCIQKAMADKDASKRVTLMLMEHKLDAAYLDRLTDWLMDLENVSITSQ